MGHYRFLWAPSGFFNGWFGIGLLSLILLGLTACCCRWCCGLFCDLRNLARKREFDDIESEPSSQESHKSLTPWTTYQENLKRTNLSPEDAFPHVMTYQQNYSGSANNSDSNFDQNDEKYSLPVKIISSEKLLVTCEDKSAKGSLYNL